MASHQFTLGDFTCRVIVDGALPYPHPAQTLFPQRSPAELACALRPYQIAPQRWNEQVLPNLCLLVDTGQQRVLIDTGSGPVSPKVGQVLPHLQAFGLTPADIDVVVLSHAHADHSGGAVDRQGAPAFPQARYYLTADEWHFWIDKPDLSPLPLPEPVKQKISALARKNLLPLRRQVTLVADGDEVVPGIRVQLAPGHTPGHMALVIRSQGQEMLYLGDLVLHPLHVAQPTWVPTVDLLPAISIQSRQRLLAQAATHKTLVQLYHFPFPGLGYIAQTTTGWQWQALATGQIDQ